MSAGSGVRYGPLAAGGRFGRLTITQDLGCSQVLARCDCGSDVRYERQQIRRGRVVSCGCAKRERAREMNQQYNLRHGGKGTRLYAIWGGMIARCHNPNTEHFARYGARGIEVCARWREDFVSFREDMGEPPSGKHSLDRINGGGNYEPGNVRWATHSEQSRNRRSNTILTLNGESACLAEWASRTGLDRVTITSRIRKGWTVEEALTRPLRGTVTK